jgi:hypothetical protein
MARLISLAVAVMLLAGAGIVLTACESTQTGATQSQFDQPFDGTWFKGRRD